MTLTKSRTILWLLIPATFVVAYFWENDTPTVPLIQAPDSNPDYFLTQTKTVEFSTDGNANRSYASEKMSHFIEAQKTEFIQPIFELTSTNHEQHQHWQLSAQQATSNGLSEELTLDGNVVLKQFTPTKDPTLLEQADVNVELTTAKLLLDFPSMVAETQEKVKLKTARFLHSADGMSADFINNTIEFKSNVETQEL